MKCPRCKGTILGTGENTSCINCGYVPTWPAQRLLSEERQDFRPGLARDLGVSIQKLDEELTEEDGATWKI